MIFVVGEQWLYLKIGQNLGFNLCEQNLAITQTHLNHLF